MVIAGTPGLFPVCMRTSVIRKKSVRRKLKQPTHGYILVYAGVVWFTIGLKIRPVRVVLHWLLQYIRRLVFLCLHVRRRVVLGLW